MIRFQCPACNKVLKAPEHSAGRKINCPECGQRLFIPPPAQPTNQTMMGRPLPDPAPPPRAAPDWLSDVEKAEGLDEPPPPRRPPDVSDSDRSALLGLVKDPEPEGPPQPPGEHVLVECPTCHSALRVPVGLLGQQVVCPHCRTTFATLAPPPAASAPVHPQQPPGLFAFGTTNAGFVGQQPSYGPPPGGPPPPPRRPVDVLPPPENVSVSHVDYHYERRNRSSEMWAWFVGLPFGITLLFGIILPLLFFALCLVLCCGLSLVPSPHHY